MSNTILTLSSVSLRAPHKLLFSNFTATVHRGDRIALIGPNGTGKTTFLKLLKDVQQPPEGRISYAPDLTVGLLAQSMELDLDQTVWDVITQPVAHELALLAQFSRCNDGAESLSAEQYDTLLTTLSERNLFTLPDRIERILRSLQLEEKKESIVHTLSGGQQTLLGLARLIIHAPDLLLLDEPTNNLDVDHRSLLLTLLSEYTGAVIVVSHDVPFLQSWPRSIWHLEHEQISLFHGSYDSFLTEQEHHRAQQLARKEKLITEKRALIREAKKEQRRVAESRKKGIKKHGNDRSARGAARERAGQTAGRLSGIMNHRVDEISDELRDTYIAEIISPTFTLSHHAHAISGIYVREGSVGYDQTPIVRDISLSLEYGERVALTGANGSGKSTLLKALQSAPHVIRDGTWQLPRAELIGYLDQHYRIVTEHDTAVSAVKAVHPHWTEREVRTHLSRFLFRTHDDVTTPTHHLSGGERARLALALIAAQSPSVLLLDEITNNIDLATREHCLKVLTSFPGTLIVISHDDNFLQRLNCTSWYTAAHGTLTRKEHA